jgi:hypothetical protein
MESFGLVGGNPDTRVLTNRRPAPVGGMSRPTNRYLVPGLVSRTDLPMTVHCGGLSLNDCRSDSWAGNKNSTG